MHNRIFNIFSLYLVYTFFFVAIHLDCSIEYEKTEIERKLL